ncbi:MULTISPECIES: hypothetical protein [unclassified Paludibacterium]|uniref:hypothetical protein n=1 Tax=unclassified Paludibacterium TaxID=2618429 RepID=UPI001C04F430|nr:hypothetical protein [Paludibacterium sp. B53371]BEV71271.1 hypothetical protein THUN1379_07530 [Paludibacterium sp. THUN1379]
MRKTILLFWPSFIIACLASVTFFALFDPYELKLHGTQLFSDKRAAYTFFLLAAWAFGALNTAVVFLLEKNAREVNGFVPQPRPEASVGDPDAPN